MGEIVKSGSEENKQKSDIHSDWELTPTNIVRELDKYVIGQEEAKRIVAIALRNRWRRRKVMSRL
ncbi:MAG: hypothetical protein ACPLRO_10045, partial [Candidatus Kapaibacteriota bacterium]